MPQPASTQLPVSEIRFSLLDWYSKHKRSLPWRDTKDPYAIWLSEIMLQQTTVETAIPYFKKFLSRFPSLKSVAEASIEELLLLWQGLGYYNRIRQFHRAAQMVVNENGGVIPSTKDELVKLPGLGDYTSGAVASIAFGQATSAVDGNVIRVLARLLSYSGDPGKVEGKNFFREAAGALVDPKHPGDFNQALMDLGSLICTPTQPACLICPLNGSCRATRGGKPESFPMKSKKAVTRKEELVCLLYHRKGKFLFRQRRDDEIMAGLWEFPLSAKRKVAGIKLKQVSHAIMNRRITVHPFLVAAQKEAGKNKGRWLELDRTHELPLTTITRKILKDGDLRKIATGLKSW